MKDIPKKRRIRNFDDLFKFPWMRRRSRPRGSFGFWTNETGSCNDSIPQCVLHRLNSLDKRLRFNLIVFGPAPFFSRFLMKSAMSFPRIEARNRLPKVSRWIALARMVSRIAIFNLAMCSSMKNGPELRKGSWIRLPSSKRRFTGSFRSRPGVPTFPRRLC